MLQITRILLKKQIVKRIIINTKDGNVTTSTVELKTSRRCDKNRARLRRGYSNVNDYSKYLQEKIPL